MHSIDRKGLIVINIHGAKSPKTGDHCDCRKMRFFSCNTRIKIIELNVQKRETEREREGGRERERERER